ncbi:MAG TPA: hypothetical protein VK646_00680 [Actinomycetota bacterium]|nr:hypothetical protein [Actinomycetota bacterium]
MAKYLLLYTGGSMPETEAEQAAAMKAWDGWFHTLGSAVVDGGNPTSGQAKTIANDGAVRDGGAAAVTGYSILEAGSLDEATTLAKDCPVLQGGGGISVHEVLDVM